LAKEAKMKKNGFLILLLAIINVTVFADEETVITDYSTYQTGLTDQDIAEVFSSKLINYLAKNSYYLCIYSILKTPVLQDMSWGFLVIRNTYNWGTVFTLEMKVSNGWFFVKVADAAFRSGDNHAYWMGDTRSSRRNMYTSIANEFSSFVQESKMVLKMNNENYSQASLEAFAYILSTLESE
jgi:hypothetical protein